MKSDWKQYKISDFILRKKETVVLDDKKTYKRITIKMHNKGICVRDEVAGSSIGTKNQFTVKVGWLLLSKIDARNGAFGIIPEEADGGIITGNFWAYELDLTKISPAFFFYFSHSAKFLEFCIASSQGATNRRYLQEDLFLNKEILLPTLPEQERIVKKIKEIEERVNKLKDINDRRLLEVQAIVDSLINSKISGISKRELDEKNDFVFSTRGKGPEYSQNSDTICLNQKCNRWNKIDLSHAKTVSKKWFEGIPKEMFTREEDVIINSTGDGTVGRASLVTKEHEGLIYDSHILLIRLNKNKIDPRFFVKIFNSRFGQQQVEDNISAKTTKQTELGMNNLMKTKIPDISIDEQKSIFDFFNKLEQKVNDAKKIMSKAESYNHALMPSILSKAFSGEL